MGEDLYLQRQMFNVYTAAFDEYLAAFSKKTDPELSKRKPDSPAGMKVQLEQKTTRRTKLYGCFTDNNLIFLMR